MALVVMNWNAVIEGTSGGVAASLILGTAVVFRGWARERLLRFRLRRDFKRHSYGSSVNGVTIGISNRVGRVFVVRSVALVAGKMNLGMNPTGDADTDFGPVKLTREQKRLLKTGMIDRIPIDSRLQRKWSTPVSPKGSITVEPYTRHQFVLPLEMMVLVKEPIQAVKATIEYTNWSGDVRLISVETTSTASSIQGSVDALKSQIENGGLNKFRQSLGLRPVKLPTEEQPQES